MSRPTPPGQSVFPRGESAVAHSVYGLILTMATLGELLEHEESAGTSVAWLLGAGAVVFVAHLFSDALARIVATQDDPVWRDVVQIARKDLSVVFGAVGAASVMAVAALADVQSDVALRVCIAAGLVALAALTAYATAAHRGLIRLVMSAVAVGSSIAIVALENTL